jgi:hypothetical protein
MNLAEKMKIALVHAYENRTRIAEGAVTMIRTAHAAASNPDVVVASLAKSAAKRAGIEIESDEAKAIGKMVVRGIRNR